MGGRVLELTTEKIRREGFEEGEEVGRGKGTNELGELMHQLLKLKRYEDAEKASIDPKERQRLYAEFGIA